MRSEMTSDFDCRELGPDTYALTYTLQQGKRLARRLTLWRRAPEGWKILYHQGTAVESAPARVPAAPPAR
jgi:hypothetical protein